MNNLLDATETTTVTYKIPSFRMDELTRKLASLAKRAIKLNVSGLTGKVVGTEVKKIDVGTDDTGKPVYRECEYTLVEVAGESPKIAGYTFAATVETVDGTDSNIIHSIPGCNLEAPVCYRASGKICEHCNKSRNRNDTYLVRNDFTEEWFQVGKNCLKDFLGEDVSAFMARLSWWTTLGLFSEINPDDLLEGGRYTPLHYRDTFLAAVAYFVRTAGWVGRAKAKESGEALTATADDALWLISPSFNHKERAAKDKLREKMTQKDTEVAEKTLAWVRENWAVTLVADRKEYEHNVVVAIESGDEYNVVSDRTAGLVGSAVFCYLRDMRQLEERKAEDAGRLNEHFGEVGGGDEVGVYKSGKRKGETKFAKGYSLTLTIVSIREKVDPYGEYPTTFIHKMRDESGRTFTWFGSRHIEIEILDAKGEYDDTYHCCAGDTFTATFAVKAHNEFKGRLETIVNRPRKETLVSKKDA